MTSEQWKAAIRRNLGEVNWAKSQRTVSAEIAEVNLRLYGDEVLGQCMVALSNDTFSHLMKVLDTHQRAASFWAIYNEDTKKLNDLVAELGVDIDVVRSMSSKLRTVRNKTHFHIDEKGMIDPEEIWRSANITGKDLDGVIAALHGLLSELYRREVSERIPFYGYEGGQTTKLFQLAKENGLVRG